MSAESGRNFRCEGIPNYIVLSGELAPSVSRVVTVQRYIKPAFRGRIIHDKALVSSGQRVVRCRQVIAGIGLAGCFGITIMGSRDPSRITSLLKFGQRSPPRCT
jgi:hypothetical protein